MTHAPSGGDSGPPPALGPEWTRCWRCAKAIPRTAGACAECGAPRRRRADVDRAPDATAPITHVMAFFAILLLISVAFGTLTSFGLREETPSPATARKQLHMVLAVEIIDAALIGAALLVIRRPGRWPGIVNLPQPLLWTAAVVGVFGLVAINAAYHHMLRAYLGVEPMRDAIVAATGVSPLVVFAYCLQPAVVEELFFRRLTLDTLRTVVPVHQAVFISSLMFGFAHIGVPLSVPMLIVVGLALGYARVASGGLALPMLIHFLHNAIILALE